MKVSASKKAFEDANFKNDELVAKNEKQAQQLLDEKEKNRDMKEKSSKEISNLKKLLNAPIVSKAVDRNTGEHVRNVVPKRSVTQGPSGAPPNIFLVKELLADEEARKKN